MANRLIDETSPYLLQHAHNPVDWYPWGEEALGRARAENRPILLSIGYSACHWCHVMERESFENDETARLMNERFVNIKVDREERPDLDAIYMEAVQAMTGHGGWPMTVFLTPDGVPFYGGTYFPPVDRQGMPGFPRVLRAIGDAYRDSPDEIRRNSEKLRGQLGRSVLGRATGSLDAGVAEAAFAALASSYDPRHGGFGGAPKFPQPMNYEFLLRYHRRSGDGSALEMTLTSLDHMSAGGIYDQLGGGFHRYATDDIWLVPHFEKMLYDNALLAGVYLEAFQVTGREDYRRVVEETLDYVLREMTAPEGGFYCAQDADSEGVEGKFFVWTPEEIERLLGPDDARVIGAYYGVTARGNFEGATILHRARNADDTARSLGLTPEAVRATVDRARIALFTVRERRVKPARDEKVLTSWNGLMLRAMARAARVLGRDDYRAAAERNAAFLLDTMLVDEPSEISSPGAGPPGPGRLRRSYKDGRARLNGYLEDYAALADGLLALYEATFEPRWFAAARELADTMTRHFWDDTEGGFFSTSDDHETLISRPKDLFDNAVPSGNSIAVEVLLRLYAFTGDASYYSYAERTLAALSGVLARAPGAFGRMLAALEWVLATPLEIAIAGQRDAPDTRALLGIVAPAYLPTAVTAVTAPGAVEAGLALLEGRTEVRGRAAAYVCERFACRRPVATPQALAEAIGVTPPG